MAPIKLSFQNDFTIDERFGKYPADWILHRMGDLGDFFGGTTPSTQQPSYWNGSINWLVPSDISTLPEEQKYIYDTGDKITEAGLAACSAVLLPAGTVTMSSRATLGDCVILGKEMCTNQGFISCKCNEHIINEYLLYWIRQYKNYISRYAAGTTFLEIGRRQFKKLRIAIPEPEEQALIVGALADIDRAIEVTRKAIDQAGLVKKALMQHLLSGRLKPDGTWRTPDEFYIDDRVGKVPKDWCVYRMAELGKFYGGATPSTQQQSYWNGNIYWLVPSDISSFGDDEIIIQETADKITELGLASCSATMLPQGSVSMSSRATLGDCGILGKNMCTNQGFINIVCNEKIINTYLLFWIRQNKRYISRYAAGTTFLEIGRRQFKKLRLAIPEVDEQKKIIDLLTGVDNLLKGKREKISKLISLKKALMQNLLTGKIRVRVG